MGMGHVPSGQVPGERQGHDVPGRQRRRAGTTRAVDLTQRGELGEFGESLASTYLADHGIQTLDRNVRVPGGEIDLICLDGPRRVAVEVRTRTGSGDPIDSVDYTKRLKVGRLARRAGASRVDLVGIAISAAGVELHWVPNAP